jgi:hypothetical protein
MRACGRRGFGRAGTSRTRRSPRCPSRSPACPSSAHCASAGHLRAWLRHLGAQCTFESRLAVAGCGAARDRMRVCDAVGSAVQDDREHADRRAARVVHQPVQSPFTVRPPGTWARGCGTCASDARWSLPGCGWMRCGTRSDARVRCRGFGRAGRSRTRRSPRCPSRSAACPTSAICASAGHLRAWVAALARRCSFESAGAVAGCGAARDRMRACDVVGSAVQVHREHADRRAARVVHQPVQSRHTVRPPGTCRAWLRHLRLRCTLESGGLWLDAARHAIGCACVTSWVRPCRRIVNAPIAALPESFGSLSNLGSLCVRRAPCAHDCGSLCVRCTLKSAGLWLDSVRHAIGCACADVEGYGRAGGSRTRRSPRCPSRSPAYPSSAICACAGLLRAWLRHSRVRCTSESAGAVAGCGAARDRMRVCGRRGFGRIGIS